MTISACTSGDSRSEIEGEMDEELDELAGDGLDAEITDEDAEMEDDTALEAEDAMTADVDAELDGELDGGDATAMDPSADAQASTDEMDDDEFLAEDAPSPESSVAATDDLAEGDLEKELDKGAPPTSSAAAVQDDMPLAQAEDAPPAMDDMSAQMIPKEEPPPLQPAVAANGPDEFGEAPAVVTSKESTVGTSDIFEPIPMPVVPKEDLGVSDPLVSEVDKPLPSIKAAQEIVPVAKISKKPFFENERLMNAVYIARPGEDMQSISMKIYNEDRSSQLFADNGHLNKIVTAGEKIYYNSPNRPDDKKTILTYYEDNKMSPSYYTTEPGDDIQKIGRRVLGYEDAWKEVWAVNDSLQTQALLPAGLKVRYWSGNESKINEVASVDDGADNSADLTKPPEGTLPQASVDDIEAPIDIPSPASMPEDFASNQDPMAAPINTEPVPLLPDAPAGVPAVTDPTKGNDSLATMAGIALVGLAGVALVAIQIKNRKKNDQGLPPSLEFTKV